jgi:hypothetical protein
MHDFFWSPNTHASVGSVLLVWMKLARSSAKKLGRSILVLWCLQGKFNRKQCILVQLINQRILCLSRIIKLKWMHASLVYIYPRLTCNTINRLLLPFLLTRIDVICVHRRNKNLANEKKKRSIIGMMGALTPPSKSLSYIRGSDRRETITLWIKRLLITGEI